MPFRAKSGCAPRVPQGRRADEQPDGAVPDKVGVDCHQHASNRRSCRTCEEEEGWLCFMSVVVGLVCVILCHFMSILMSFCVILCHFGVIS